VLKGVTVTALAVVAFAAGSRAHAATLNFALTGDYTASWSLDSDPTPSGSSTVDGYTFFNGVSGVSPLSLVFYSSTLGFGSGGMRFSTTPDPTTESGATVDLAGDQVYTGTVASPHFAVGVYTFNFDFLTNDNTVHTTTLTVTDAIVAATPIPAALPLFLTALGGVGFLGWRRRRAADKI